MSELLTQSQNVIFFIDEKVSEDIANCPEVEKEARAINILVETHRINDGSETCLVFHNGKPSRVEVGGANVSVVERYQYDEDFFDKAFDFISLIAPRFFTNLEIDVSTADVRIFSC